MVIHGLRRREDINGNFAVVLRKAETPGFPRYHLCLENTGAEISARADHITKIKISPSSAVDVHDTEPVDTSTLLKGDCAICLGEKQATLCIVPCGHVSVCATCAPRLRMAHGKCPICRGSIQDFLPVYLPGGTVDEEVAKANARCKEAEKRVRELEESTPRQKPKKRPKILKPEVGVWVQVPSTKKSQLHTEYAMQFGAIVSVSASAYTVRFHGVDEDVFTRTGEKFAAPGHKDIKFPIDFKFKTIREDPEDKLCVLTSAREKRKRLVKAAQRFQEMRLRDAIDVS